MIELLKLILKLNIFRFYVMWKNCFYYLSDYYQDFVLYVVRYMLMNFFYIFRQFQKLNGIIIF